MKSVYLFLWLVGFPALMTAQRDSVFGRSEFDDFRKELLGEYNDFRKEINAEYADFLSKAWKEYRLFQGKSADKTPKPLQPIPYREIKDERDVVVEATSEKVAMAEDVKPLDEELLMRELTKDSQVKGTSPLNLDYFGAELQFRYQQTSFHLTSIVESSVGGLWKDISKSRFTSLLADMLAYKKEMQMNDWAYFLLAGKVADRLSTLKSEDGKAVFQHFLLVQSGYDVRLARIDNFLVLLVPISEEVYSRPYLTIDDKLFYAISGKNLSSFSQIFTYQLPKKLIDKSHLSLQMKKELRLPVHSKSYCVKAGGIAVSGEININQIRFYQAYLSCELSVYAEARPSARIQRQLVSSLKSQLAGKSGGEALNTLLKWIQNGFRYQTDGQQFGYEKPFFIDENFYYPASDCEDRAILFAYLVREVLGQEVILLDYPGHVSTAVCMGTEEVKGAYVVLDKKKFVICDPTYMNADAGRLMPSCKGKRPKVIRLNYD